MQPQGLRSKPKDPVSKLRVDSVRVTFLGTGDAFFGTGMHQAGYLVQSDGGTILLDCGCSTLAALKQSGLSCGPIDTILISHLHGDHFSGIPFLLLEYMYREPRTRKLRIAGPPGVERRVHALFAAMYKDTAAQLLPFALEFVELRPGKLAQIGDVRVSPFRVPHQEKEISLAFSAEVDGRQILYSGDTGWTEDLIVHSEGKDLFICECSFYETRTAFHLDYPCLLENHARFGSSRLILTHLGEEVLRRKAGLELELATDSLILDI
jgi:ribonuclease BN (tRNA processing enzyme)